ncbi:MAG TPA: FlgD immunoglobulin-like domain containing protein [bacterium]|nr:FlgD immunoglobulin-like domain containing protein [bacterium]
MSLACLKLFQIEEEPGDDGGVQSFGSGHTYVTRLRDCSPNPFARGTSVNYELAQYGPVEITVHDVLGRLVRRLESGPRQRGIHVARWDGTDNRGRVVPAGVYFVRLSAGGKASTGRMTLVR